MQSSPFLSILIPVYNWDIRELLQKIHTQAERLLPMYRIEILVMDDGSEEPENNRAFAEKLPLARFTAFPENRGRVVLRNLLLDEAEGDYVLFLDADMLPDHDTFLRTYVEKALAGNDIICGGISYRQIRHLREDFSFYYYKSRKTEAVPVILRNRQPWRYLFTSNILLRRTILDVIRFDSRFSGYGFEDIEWAIRLGKFYEITHIENSCSHMGLMTKPEAYAKMSQSIENYALLLSLHPEITAGSSATKAVSLLKVLPHGVLNWLDFFLEKMFFMISWNPVAFLIFQCDKMVLLTKVMKKNNKVGLY
jgi:glycosyltransferase involved in cell wall biosynthesis